ncbi:DUF397 domain-containing protein [Streptomyces sp. NPDC006012]|uniref:DUF397 domain-containing protein n=1 Tax=Streptomyces sp. NPDC006012 TaxID=3364739 RepID=UPI0036BA88AA
MNGKTGIDHEQLLEQLNAATWVKGRRSSGGTNCVEIAFLPQLVCFRESKNLDQQPLLFTRSAYEAFVGGLEQSELPS